MDNRVFWDEGIEFQNYYPPPKQIKTWTSLAIVINPGNRLTSRPWLL